MNFKSTFGWLRNLLLKVITACSLVACSNIDCPLDNQVVMTLAFFNSSSGVPLSISDSLSVYGLQNGKEEILFNRGISLKSITLPLNQASDKDTLLLVFHSDTESIKDTLFLRHSRQAHFEAIDCPASIFHHILSSRISARIVESKLPIIDSVIISNPNVNYEDVENIKVFFRPIAQ